MKQFQVVAARWKPKRTDDLVGRATHFIGFKSQWQAIFKIDQGRYESQWAMMNVDFDIHLPFAWVPESDLEVVE